MTKRVHDEIMSGLQDAIAYSKGKHAGSKTHRVKVREVDVRKARTSLKLTQEQFAQAFGVSPQTIRNWEQGQRQPRGAALVLLNVIERNPKAVRDAISA